MATTETPPPRRICATCDWWAADTARAYAQMDVFKLRNDVRTAEEISDLDDAVSVMVDAQKVRCNRFPPFGGVWAETFGGYTCGEWQPRRKDRGGEHE